MYDGVYRVIATLIEEALNEFDRSATLQIMKRVHKFERPTLNRIKAAVIADVLVGSGFVVDRSLLN